MSTNEKITELLTEIEGKVKEVRQILQRKRICNQCQIKIVSKSCKQQISMFDFCSQDCWDKWNKIE